MVLTNQLPKPLEKKKRLAVVLLALLTMSWSIGLSQETISKVRLGQAVRDARTKLREGLHVRYQVSQKIAEPGIRYGLVHFGSSSDGSSLDPFWHAEHAMAGGKEYHRAGGTVNGYKDSDRIYVYDDQYYYSTVPLAPVFNAYLKAYHDVKDLPLDAVPVEELYWELIGFQSRSAGQGNGRVTLSGAGYAEPYDLLEVLADEAYSLELAESEVTLTKPGVERITLDANRGYAVLRRQRNWPGSEQPMVAFENTAFAELDAGVWLPLKSVIQYYPKPEHPQAGSVAVVATMSVDSISLRPAASLLVPNLEGVIQVMDLRHRPDGKVDVKPVFIKDLDGTELAEFLKDAPRGVGPNPYR